MEETVTAFALTCEVARQLSAASLGIFAGGMLTEGCVLVSYWRSLKPTSFLAWYAANGQRLQGFYAPLTTVTTLLSITAALMSIWEGHPGRWFATLAALYMLAAVGAFFIYFGKANASFADASISEEKVPAELARWAAWHWWRAGLSLVALACGMMALG